MWAMKRQVRARASMFQGSAEQADLLQDSEATAWEWVVMAWAWVRCSCPGISR